MTLRTRLAPSPTGKLHLGNARTFLINWLLARQTGSEVLLRIEDLDTARSKPALIDAAIADLEWLGLSHDGDVTRQSDRVPHFATAAQTLHEQGLLYACTCTRKDIRAVSAPHAEDEEITYPGTCRERPAHGRLEDLLRPDADGGRVPALRFRVPKEVVTFQDGFCGPQSLLPAMDGGDFVIRSPDGMWSYQLAVSVDDAAMGITDVVRGDDLIPSTPRQILIHQALGATPPRYSHLPLVQDETGRRLAKRHGDTELEAIRARGVSAERVVALLARLSGVGAGDEISAAELVDRFDLEHVPRVPVQLPPLPW